MNFQGYGRYLTDSSGNYMFRTIKPVSYTLQGMFRAPHIHVAVSKGGKRIVQTQIGIRGHQDNAKDPVWNMLKGAARETVVTDFVPMPGSRTGELTAKFDVVLNRTAFEGDDGGMIGGIGKSTWKGFGRWNEKK